jgi:[pyruvate, water dikinase]-phosphate phosphotransferase / [pyruvate, water dikinase] kinase
MTFSPNPMSNDPRIVFIVSDGTGITAENFSQSILAQFEATFKHIRVPFVDSVDKAHDAVAAINQAASKYGVQPIVFTTLITPELNAIVARANGLILDMFQTFVAPLEQALLA